MNEAGIVTTPRKREDLGLRARKTADRIGLPFIPRNEKSYDRLREETGADAFYIEAQDAPFIQTGKGPFFFHENTSGMRIKNSGATPTIVEALDLRPDSRVLDVTLGLATDALVTASYLTTGKVKGLEISVMLADIVSRGLNNYTFSSERLEKAAGRIEVFNADYRQFLENCSDGEFDVVYFDPMFEKTVKESSSMQRVREIAGRDTLTEESVKEACRVAARRVVIKARRGFFGSIDFSSVLPCGNRIIYGIIEI